jgi:hypothetical protein
VTFIVIATLLLADVVFASFLSAIGASSATVTITPENTDLKNTYTISIVTGTPDASSNEVGGARLLSSTTPSSMQTANATGRETTPGTQASGTLRIEDHDNEIPLTLRAGEVFPNQKPSPAIEMQLDETVTVGPGSAVDNVSAHVVEFGTIGNIFPCCGPHPSFQNQCTFQISSCSQGYDIFSDSTFTGGKDPQTYSVVQQSDIDNAAEALEQANTPDAQQVLHDQVYVNEQFITTPQCKPKVTADHVAGDRATSVTVTVTFTCTGEVYSQDAALAMATQLLSNQAATDLGLRYALAGNIATIVTDATVPDAQQGTIMLTVNVEGVWVFQFSAARQRALAMAMAGKVKQNVRAFLRNQKGIAQVSIDLMGGNGTLFPRDASQIKIVVQSVPGVQSTTTPTTS